MIFQIITLLIVTLTIMLSFQKSRNLLIALFLLSLTPSYLRKMAAKCKNKRVADLLIYVANKKEGKQ